MATLAAPYFHDEEKAREYLEGIRWPDGPVCPKCGGIEKIYRITGKTARPGLLKCGAPLGGLDLNFHRVVRLLAHGKKQGARLGRPATLYRWGVVNRP